tara:strand:+ start:78 stop:464 length:387 start_codon:yes stop_codon:yes gene_type:complete
MAIRIDLSQDQDVEVTATFEVCDEVPDGVSADDAEDILELMDNSNISMAEVIEAAVLNGVDMPEAHAVDYDKVKTFLESGGPDTGAEFITLIRSLIDGLTAHIQYIERANIQMRDTIDTMSAADQKIA